VFDPIEHLGGNTILIDDATGTAQGVPLSSEASERLKIASLLHTLFRCGRISRPDPQLLGYRPRHRRARQANNGFAA